MVLDPMKTDSEIEAEEKQGEDQVWGMAEWTVVVVILIGLFAAAWQVYAALHRPPT